MQTRASLSPRDAAGPDELRLACPDIAAACDFPRTFTDLLRHRRGYLQHDWIRQAEQTTPAPVKSFAGFPRQDIDAVLAGLTSDYSSGVVEGHVNRLTTLKGQMFNRAGLLLLRKRVLLAASFTSRNDVSALATSWREAAAQFRAPRAGMAAPGPRRLGPGGGPGPEGGWPDRGRCTWVCRHPGVPRPVVVARHRRQPLSRAC